MVFNELIPELSVSDLEKSREFYVEQLGFKVSYERPEEGFVFLSRGGVQLMLERRNGSWETGKLEKPFGRGVNFQIKVADPKALYNSLKNNGQTFYRELSTNSYGTANGEKKQTEFLIQDPDGYLLRFCD